MDNVPTLVGTVFANDKNIRIIQIIATPNLLNFQIFLTPHWLNFREFSNLRIYSNPPIIRYSRE